jgi:uncharacterized protein (DUF1800 family)
MSLRKARRGVALVLALALGACGGGGSGGGSTGTATPPTTPAASISAAEASRFLTQASFGPTDADITAVRSAGYGAWIDQQIAMPASGSHLAFMDNRLIQERATNPQANLSATEFYESFWQQAAQGPDQLRQRVKLALSEIFVVSLADPNVDERGAGSYYDMLGANAFGNFRTLLEQVSLHPQMGVYLTWMSNQKEDAVRHPDENYAREVMQLMAIGLYQLNPDGSRKLDVAGAPIPTYSSDDISGLAKVFTGYGWYSTAPTNNRTFFGTGLAAAAQTTAMIPYPVYHSTSAKSFLGATIPASTTIDPAGDLKVALDTLFNHPNTGPFISRQLIQRLVTSNPSPAYVARVAAVFANNGQGVRGDMGAVVKAILTDSEARTAPAASDLTYGKLREPVVRMGNWMRAFGATSASGSWLIASTSANTSLDQSALTSPSVFNFWRPGYSPPNTRIGAQGLVAPEFQVVDEVSVAGYLNTMQSAIDTGLGTGRDVAAAYAAEKPLASDVNALVDRVNLMLTAGQMSAGLRSRIVTAVSAVAIPGGAATQAQIDTATLNRVKLAVFMIMASPEYLMQR